MYYYYLPIVNTITASYINKQCILTMLESTKHLLFGTFSKERSCFDFENQWNFIIQNI